MKYSEAGVGRVFVLRLENGDRIPDVIEEFAKDKQIQSAIVHFLGGADTKSKVVVGPEDGTASKLSTMVLELAGVHEALGVGTIFLNEEGNPKLHLHSAFGRNDGTITGCTREGVIIWHVGEVIILELVNIKATRKFDPAKGLNIDIVT